MAALHPRLCDPKEGQDGREAGQRQGCHRRDKYDGRLFNVVLADVPEKKSDFVQGKYTLAAPTNETTVAVKIIDMLGEEVLLTEQLPALSK